MDTQSDRWKILVVEDNPVDVCMLGLALEDAGLAFDMINIKDGLEAITFVRNEGEKVCPDLFVIDLHVPRASGVEVVAAFVGATPCVTSR